MNVKNVGLIAAIAAFTWGCASPVPVATNFPLTFQKVARTAHHWDVVADDVVSQTTEKIQADGGLRGRQVYVPEPVRNSVFDASFRDFLINRMVERGMVVSVCPVPDGVSSPDLQVRYSTRVIAHSANMPNYQPGVLTALASGVWVAHAIGQGGLSADAARGLGFGVAVGLDVLAGHVATPTRTEIIVTTTIAEGNRFLMRRSDVYYVPDADGDLFTQQVVRGSECRQRGSSVALSKEDKEIELEQARHDYYVRDSKRSNAEWTGAGYSR